MKLSPAEKLALWLLLTWCWCACATSHRVAVQQTSESQGTSQIEVVTKTETGPEKTVTTVEEFAPVEAPQVPGPTAQAVQRGSQHPDGRGPAVRPFHGPLVKRTVTVTEKAPATQVVEEKAQDASTTHAATDIKTEDSSRPAGIWLLLSIVWPYALVGGLCVAAGALWKWRAGWVPVVLGLFRKKA